MDDQRYFALVHFPDIQDKRFHAFRNKYDPYASLLREHISLIFNVPESIGLEMYTEHVHSILTKWNPFKVTIAGFHKTVDHWLLLTITDGNEKVVKLHDAFYTGILSPYLRKDLPFIPHIGLGFFGKESYDLANPTAKITLDEEKYNRAMAEIAKEDLSFQKTIDSLSIIELNESLTKCRTLKTFSV